MSNERKEPTLTGMAPTAEENPNRGTQAAPKRSAAPQRKRPTPVSAQQAKPSPLVPLALILALTGLGLAGFSYWQLLKAQQQVSSAEGRLLELEKRLTLSDDESTQSVSVLQANVREARDELKLAHTEIRKLWDTRNVNRKAISENKKQLASVAKSAKSAAQNASDAKAQATSQAKELTAMSSDLALQTEQLSLATDMADSQQKRLRELVDQANRADTQLKQIKVDLLKRVKSNEEAIEAIDNYRRSVNRDILEIKRQLNPSSATAQ